MGFRHSVVWTQHYVPPKGGFKLDAPIGIDGEAFDGDVQFAEGKLKPHVSQTLPLEKAAEALKLMAARQVKGKLVLTVA